MAKLTLSDLSGGYLSPALVNANNTAIEAALENTLSRDGTSPNAMEAVLDMNSFRVINVGEPTAASDAVRLSDLQESTVNTPLPSHTGHTGHMLVSDGGAASWEDQGYINVKHPPYNATGDGVTDDGAAIQAALDTGKKIYIPYGTYKYSTGLVIPRASHAVIVGDGITRSILKYTGSGKALSYSTSVVNIVRGTILRDFMLDCQTSTATHGLHFSNDAGGNGFSWGDVRNLYVFGPSTASSNGIVEDGVVYTTFQNVISRGWDTGWDVNVVGVPSSNNTYQRCVAMSCLTYGYRTRELSTNCVWINCEVEGESTYGWHVSGYTASTQPESHTWIQCGSEDDHAGADFYIENCKGILFLGGGPGTNVTGHGIQLVNVRQSHFLGFRTGETYDPAKYALIADSNSVFNEFKGYIRDSRNLLAVSLADNRNIRQFNFSSNATSPLTMVNGPAYVTTSSTGAVNIDPRRNGSYIIDTSGGNVTQTIGSLSAQNEGIILEIKKGTADANIVTIDPASTQTIDGASNYVLRYPDETLIIKGDFTISGEWIVLAHYIPAKAPTIVTTAVGNVGGGTDALQASSVAIGSLLAAGDGIHVTQSGTHANNANAKTLTSQAGGQILVTQALTISIAGEWLIEYDLFSTGVDTQYYTGKLMYETAAGVWATVLFRGTLALDDGAAITVRCTGAGTADNDIVQDFQKINYIRRTT